MPPSSGPGDDEDASVPFGGGIAGLPVHAPDDLVLKLKLNDVSDLAAGVDVTDLCPPRQSELARDRMARQLPGVALAFIVVTEHRHMMQTLLAGRVHVMKGARRRRQYLDQLDIQHANLIKHSAYTDWRF